MEFQFGVIFSFCRMMLILDLCVFDDFWVLNGYEIVYLFYILGFVTVNVNLNGLFLCLISIIVDSVLGLCVTCVVMLCCSL